MPGVDRAFVAGDQGRTQRQLIAEAAEQAERHLQPLVDKLPVQAIHMDITDDNVVWQRDANATGSCRA
jgi:Ser/Thr protein kinase RdoA (MazF antagonist)